MMTAAGVRVSGTRRVTALVVLVTLVGSVLVAGAGSAGAAPRVSHQRAALVVANQFRVAQGLPWLRLRAPGVACHRDLARRTAVAVAQGRRVPPVRCGRPVMARVAVSSWRGPWAAARQLRSRPRVRWALRRPGSATVTVATAWRRGRVTLVMVVGARPRPVVKPAPKPAPTPAPEPDEPTVAELEAEVRAYVEAEIAKRRTAAGLPPAQRDACLDARVEDYVAQLKSTGSYTSDVVSTCGASRVGGLGHKGTDGRWERVSTMWAPGTGGDLLDGTADLRYAVSVSRPNPADYWIVVVFAEGL